MVNYLRIGLLGLVLLQSTNPSWGAVYSSIGDNIPRSRTWKDTAWDVMKGLVLLAAGGGAGWIGRGAYDGQGGQGNAIPQEFGNRHFPCSNGISWSVENKTGCLRDGQLLAATENGVQVFNGTAPDGYRQNETNFLVVTLPDGFQGKNIWEPHEDHELEFLRIRASHGKKAVEKASNMTSSPPSVWKAFFKAQRKKPIVVLRTNSPSQAMHVFNLVAQNYGERGALPFWLSQNNGTHTFEAVKDLSVGWNFFKWFNNLGVKEPVF